MEHKQAAILTVVDRLMDKDPQAVSDHVAKLHPGARLAMEDKECIGWLNQWSKCSKESGEDGEKKNECRMLAANWINCSVHSYLYTKKMK